MKRLLTGFAILALVGNAMTFCSKKNPSVDLSLLQHKWMIHSITGEALYYRGIPQDYYEFGTNKVVISYVEGHYDTAAYSLTAGGSILQLFQISNGIPSPYSYDLSIKTLTSSQLILEYHPSSPVIHGLDSLQR